MTRSSRASLGLDLDRVFGDRGNKILEGVVQGSEMRS